MSTLRLAVSDRHYTESPGGIPDQLACHLPSTSQLVYGPQSTRNVTIPQDEGHMASAWHCKPAGHLQGSVDVHRGINGSAQLCRTHACVPLLTPCSHLTLTASTSMAGTRAGCPCMLSTTLCRRAYSLAGTEPRGAPARPAQTSSCCITAGSAHARNLAPITIFNVQRPSS